MNATEIADDILSTIRKCKEKGTIPCSIKLSAEKYSELMTHPAIAFGNQPPSPPVKAKGNISGSGFLSSFSGSYVEYDYAAPEYIEAYKKWRRNKAKDDRPRIFGIPIEIAK